MGKFHLPISPATVSSIPNKSLGKSTRQKEPLHFRAATNRIAKKAGNFLSKSHTAVISSDPSDSLSKRLSEQFTANSSPLKRAFSFKNRPLLNKTPSQISLLDQNQMHRTDVATAASTWRQLLGEDHLRYLNLDPAEIRYQEAVHEIIATEADYVNDLKLVYKVSRRPHS
jgi:hypothetical protein